MNHVVLVAALSFLAATSALVVDAVPDDEARTIERRFPQWRDSEEQRTYTYTIKTPSPTGEWVEQQIPEPAEDGGGYPWPTAGGRPPPQYTPSAFQTVNFPQPEFTGSSYRPWLSSDPQFPGNAYQTPQAAPPQAKNPPQGSVPLAYPGVGLPRSSKGGQGASPVPGPGSYMVLGPDGQPLNGENPLSFLSPLGWSNGPLTTGAPAPPSPYWSGVPTGTPSAIASPSPYRSASPAAPEPSNLSGLQPERPQSPSAPSPTLLSWPTLPSLAGPEPAASSTATLSSTATARPIPSSSTPAARSTPTVNSPPGANPTLVPSPPRVANSTVAAGSPRPTSSAPAANLTPVASPPGPATPTLVPSPPRAANSTIATSSPRATNPALAATSTLAPSPPRGANLTAAESPARVTNSTTAANVIPAASSPRAVTPTLVPSPPPAANLTAAASPARVTNSTTAANLIPVASPPRAANSTVATSSPRTTNSAPAANLTPVASPSRPATPTLAPSPPRAANSTVATSSPRATNPAPATIPTVVPSAPRAANPTVAASSPRAANATAAASSLLAEGSTLAGPGLSFSGAPLSAALQRRANPTPNLVPRRASPPQEAGAGRYGRTAGHEQAAGGGSQGPRSPGDWTLARRHIAGSERAAAVQSERKPVPFERKKGQWLPAKFRIPDANLVEERRVEKREDRLGPCADLTVLFASGSITQASPEMFNILGSVMGKGLTVQGVTAPDESTFVEHGRDTPGSPDLAILIIETKAQCPQTKLVVAGPHQRGEQVNDMFAYYLSAKMVDAVMLFDNAVLTSSAS